jgi:hypothetical protein
METGRLIMEVATWTVIAAIIVFVIMQAPKVAVAVTSIGGWVTSEEAVLAGSKAA